jgi:hypothetical protein
MAVIALVLTVSSCEKAELPKSTTYILTMAMSDVQASSTVHFDLTAFEYNEENERVASNDLPKAVSGSSKTFIANARAVKVKIYLKMYSDNTAVSPEYRWVQQVFYLEQGRNIEIKLEDHTKVGRSEP